MAKKKRDPAQMHRQVQDSLQALPYAIQQQQKEGKRFKVAMLRFVTGPILRVMNRLLDRGRYKGPEGQKTKQAELARRHLEQRQQALKHAQTMIRQQQARRGAPKRPK